MLPILIRPQCSSSAVIAAAFHPERVNYFLLAFSDGTAAVFDATHFFRTENKSKQGARAAVSGSGGVLAFMKGLHAHGSSTGKLALDDGVSTEGIDPGTGIVGIGDKSCGITAIAFVPGRKAMVVTVGADGKCCVVDFTQTTKEKAVLLKTWHLRRPATSLSVIYSPRAPGPGQLDGTDHVATEKPSGSSTESYSARNESYYIAVGRHDGRVLLFDLNGKPLGEQTLDENGAPVVDVEWTQIENSAAPARRKSSPATTKISGNRTQRHALGRVTLPGNIPVQQDGSLISSEATAQPQDPLFDFSTSQHRQRQWPSGSVTAAASHLDTIHAPATSLEESVICDHSPQSFHRATTMPSDETVHRKTALHSATPQRYTAHDQASNEEITTPQIPPRPSPRPGGLLSMRRAHTGYSYQAPADDSYLSLIANARNVRNKLSLQANGNFGPRPMRSRDGGSPLKSSMTSDDHSLSAQSEIAWSNVPPVPPPHNPQLRPKSPTASIESFQTASSRVHTSSPSEDSTDTIVDWHVGPIRQAVPSLEEDSQQFTKDIVRRSPYRQGHISLSITSTSHDTPTSASTCLTDTASPIVQWPAFSPQYSGLGLHAFQTNHHSPTKAKPKQKGHVSVPPSSDSYNSSATASCTSGDLVVQWPPLKKSPRIPMLNKALSMSYEETSIKSVRESATGFVLQTYTGAPSQAEATSARSSKENNALQDNHSDSWGNTLEATLKTSLGSLRAEMAQRFDEQRIWLEKLFEADGDEKMALREEKMALREENRRLQTEVTKLKADRVNQSGNG